MPGAAVFRDPANALTTGNTIAPAAARTTTTTGSAVDLLAADGVCALVIHAGAVTDGTHTPSVQEATDSAFTTPVAVTPITTIVALTSATTTGSVQIVEFQRNLRYVRCVMTVTGSPGTGGVYGAWFGESTKTF